MKDKIVLFIIGVLVGAIISTGSFYIYTKTINSCDCTNTNMMMDGNEPPEKPDGETGEPPAKPSETTTQTSI